MKERILLFLILGLDAMVLLYEVSTLSITSHEADVLFNTHSFVHYLTQLSITVFGQNDYALRMPMIFFHLLSVILLYLVSKPYVKRDSDRLWLVVVYILLPGVISAALLVNSAGIMIFMLFLLLYLYQIKSPLIPLVLMLSLVIDGASALLYFSLFVYAFNKNNKFYMVFTAILFFIAYYLYGFDTMGKPSGHFLDTLGLYATIFSPVVFVFLIYVLYRKMITKEYDITLYVGGVVFVLSLLLSFRQQIHIEHFAPYLMLLLPLAAQTFFSSYRVRLRAFRGRYRVLLAVGFTILAMHFFLLLFNKGLYLFIEDPHKHFAYKTHIVKELAAALKSQNINCVSAESENLQNRLKFYSIDECSERVLYEVPLDIHSDVTISYIGRIVATYNVTKIPI
ncbi:MAG: hypothetical protein PF439_12165 [Helicobacteraceae bacterium]|jgi:hypothetical protein|nr:hypothetical protein [Helicobacteraceae bacterium]